MSEILNKRLVIADPSLKDERGHHYALTKLITKGAQTRGMEVIWLANCEHTLQKLPGVKIIPTFSSSMYDVVTESSNKTLIDVHLISRIPEFLHPTLIKIRDWVKAFVPERYKTYLLGINSVEARFQIFARELLSAITEGNISIEDHLLIHSADGTIYRGILALALEKDKWESLPIIHLCTSYDENIMPQYDNGLSVTRIIDYYRLLDLLNDRVFLYAENQSLRKHLENLWEVSIKALEIPVPEMNSTTVYTDKNTLNVVYLGAAREEKGFHLLPEVVRKTQSNREFKKNIQFIIQCSPQIIGYLPVIKKALAKLRKYPADFVRLIEQQQSMDEYYAMLDHADVVLLCYQQDKYQVRGSGIAVEAVSRGKIMIVSSNTFPAEIAGNAGIWANNAREIAEKLISISQSYDNYSVPAIKRMREYNQLHSPENYVDILLSTEHETKTNQIKSKLMKQDDIIKNENKKSNDILNFDLKLKKLVKSSCINNNFNSI